MTIKEEVLAACDLLGLDLVYSTQDTFGRWPLKFISKKTNDFVIVTRCNIIQSCDVDIDVFELRNMINNRVCTSIEDYIFKKALHILQTAKLTYDGKTIGPLNWSSLEELKLKLAVTGDLA